MIMLNKAAIMILGVFLAYGTYAETKVEVTENGNVEIAISKDNFNRLVVEHDQITQARYPSKRVITQYDKDGSLYLDARDDRPFTLFVTTKKGKHFSATVKVKEVLGQTVSFHQKQRLNPKSRKNRVESINHARKLSHLLKSTIEERDVKGYESIKVSDRERPFQHNVSLRQTYVLKKKGQIAQKFVIRNRGNRPVNVMRSWFVDRNTLGVYIKSAMLYPGEDMTVSRVEKVVQKGVHHG